MINHTCISNPASLPAGSIMAAQSGSSLVQNAAEATESVVEYRWTLMMDR